MPEPPLFDGRTPLTKEVMNDLVEAARRQGLTRAAPPLEVYNLGSGGTIVRLGTSVGAASTGDGFWARLGVDDSGATWTECMPGIDPVGGARTLVDRPGGRTGALDRLCALIQGFGNFRPSREVTYQAIRFSPAATAGEWTPSYSLSGAGAVSCPSVGALATPAEVQTSLNTPAAGFWSVSGIAGSVYYCVLDPTQGVQRTSPVTVTGNTTTATISVATEDAFGDGAGAAALYNFLPGGQAVWVRPLTAADGSLAYVFELPYCGLYARITGPATSSGYPFVEQVQTTLSSDPVGASVFFDDASGVTGYAQEVNGESLVPPDTVVWLTPAWRSAVGFAWTFAQGNDWRLVSVPASTSGYPAGTNCLISGARSQDVKGSSPYAFVQEADGSAIAAGVGTYLALRVGSTAGGWPSFVRVGGAPVGYSGSLILVQGGVTYTLTVTSGRITVVV